MTVCTGISLKSLEGNHYLGRTQEYNIDFDYAGVQIPKKIEITESIEKWQTIYSVLGIGIKESQQKVAQSVIDGVNECGLGGITQYFAEFNHYSSVEEIKKAGKLPLIAEQFVFWVLANCKNTQEIEEKILDVAIADLSVKGKAQGLPQHFMFTDATGRTIVVEPSIKLGFVVYENPVGVMTNSPKFDWHLTNLENYTGLSDENAKDALFHDHKILSAGKGSGMHGIPGDYTATSRFVRAAYLLKFSDPVGEKDIINKAFHILSTSDIVKGVVKLDEPKGEDRQYTQYTSIYDLSKRQMYIKMYDNFTIQTIHFDEIAGNEDQIKIYELVKTPQYEDLN
ncbi:choloylglycine hydrolase family protein [Enterococcus ureasiticus]|uniref:choloylglycine hydrolase family protein n=1 Tax=Enterococcus TaxID=1350 RepID=UPI001A8D9CE6|nr:MULTISPECIES: choloylglycine hydrolase family protein [Enterococcus]MBO0434800.1 choloylglycine hydrolase family protein [Enterococcus sp. DIV0849a]MBO0474157.1 choloylglycine hydrolase family protein [Enterococcus ureasiticus]